MKIVLDTKTKQIKVGKKTFGLDMPVEKQDEIISQMKNFIRENTNLSDYEEDSMWMSYRYCIGRHTIAAHMRAGDIAKECYRRMSDSRSTFTAFDINREIEQKMQWGCGPCWYFPTTSLNRIYTSAIDIYCQFVEDYEIKSKDDLLKYKDIHVILADNERGYKLDVITWEEWLRPQVFKRCQTFYSYQDKEITEEEAWKLFEERKVKNVPLELKEMFKKLTEEMPNKDYFCLMDIEDLFVWNDLCHLFDVEHHHKSVLVDGTECEWYWTYTHDSEQREDGYYYRKEIGYKRIRVPISSKDKIGHITTYIPDESIVKDLY